MCLLLLVSAVQLLYCFVDILFCFYLSLYYFSWPARTNALKLLEFHKLCIVITQWGAENCMHWNLHKKIIIIRHRKCSMFSHFFSTSWLISGNHFDCGESLFPQLFLMDFNVVMSQWRLKERIYVCTEWGHCDDSARRPHRKISKPNQILLSFKHQNGLRVWWCLANQRTSASHSRTGSRATSAQQQPAHCQRGALTGQGPLHR